MKTTVDIPESDLADAMRFTRAKTKREAIVAAIQDFNRRRRMAELVKHAGTCENMMSVEELQKQRRKG
jgi:Arc/MetJ family transcription regulator